MITGEEMERRELLRLWACISTLEQLPNNRGKGEFLLATFREAPEQIKYWRTCYDPRRWWPWRGDDYGRYLRQPHNLSIPYDYLSLFKTLRKMAAVGWPQALDAWHAFDSQHQVEVRQLNGRILQRDFACGVGLPLLNLVLERGGLGRIPLDEFRYRLGYWQPDQPYASAKLCTPEGDLDQGIRSDLAAGYCAYLRTLGVAVTTPSNFIEPTKTGLVQ